MLSLPQIEDGSRFSGFVRELLRARYLRKDETGQVIETPDDLWMRTARCVAQAELRYGGESTRERWEEEFYRIMAQLLFLPNSPTLFNAGRDPQMLFACYVLPVPDSLEGILQVTKESGLIQKSGGGVGFDFSRVRARGAVVRGTAGVASGPVSFMRGMNAWAEVIKQGGLRRAANMAVLRIDHPDAEDFITCKRDKARLEAFNLSVGVTDRFMRAVARGEDYALIDPRTGKEVARRDACQVWELICKSAWECGDPGLVFLDTVNAANTTPHVGCIDATNPCGEQPLLPYEACTLGSLNLVGMLSGGQVDWERLREVTRVAVRFLDDVIDVNTFPLPQIEAVTTANRKIGLGIMGFADLLYTVGIPYGSAEAVKLAEGLMSEISRTAKEASEELARQRGPFPNFRRSIYDQPGGKGIRNATRTTIAPTGTIGLIAGVSGGIEPNFALVYERKVGEERVLVVNPVFERVARERAFDRPGLMEEVFRRGGLKGIDAIPQDDLRVFVTAREIDPEWHVRLQAAFQKHTDNAVSKTVNLRHKASVDDVKKVFLLAWQSGCKGDTVYRDGCRQDQVLSTAKVSPDVVLKRPRPRPQTASGETFKFRMGCGTLFVTVNRDDDGLCEVFANLGKAGGCPSQSEATSRAVSIGLRSGIDPSVLVEQLKGIRCPSTCVARKGNKDVDVLSCPDAIARALEKASGQSGDAHVPERSVAGRTCPFCKHLMHREEGCFVCEECGFNSCG